ncbi:hypothetical protein MIND_00802000 [Mycena indigotica]|uniref:Uncharacterized protein n=1 Tax=Mycena indigotica TaxID=2126181 RepID=A0A8H6SGJ7_9AGAR|nr:uncharacterized protein MIND_00802000 [Mycena indigotica]KAF7298553.1 hypothetical protein MIND_00802000 [Mycena indigotica]
MSSPASAPSSLPNPNRIRRRSVDVAKRLASSVAAAVKPTPMPYVEPVFGRQRRSLGAIPMEELRPADYLPMPPREVLFPRCEQVALFKEVGLLDQMRMSGLRYWLYCSDRYLSHGLLFQYPSSRSGLPIEICLNTQ